MCDQKDELKVNFIHCDKDKIPDDLYELLMSYRGEFGVANGISKQKTPNMDLYQIIDNGIAQCVLGYFWIDKKMEKKEKEYYFSVVINEKYQRRGLSKKAITEAIRILKEKNESKLFAQVNFSQGNGGFMRKALYDYGFKLDFTKFKSNKWDNRSEKEIIFKYPFPITLFYPIE